MRTSKITLDGEERVLCFSAGVVEDVCERFGDLNGMFNALGGRGQGGEDEAAPVNLALQIKTLYWLLARMMDAGARYARRKGIPCSEPLSVEDIRDVCDLADFAALKDKVLETITSGSTREVDAEPPKNAETTAGSQAP